MESLVKVQNGLIEKATDDHGETRGPRVGVKLTLEQASIILRRHLNKSCKTVSYIERGYNNRTYIVTSEDDMQYVIRLTGKGWTRMKTENEVASIIFLASKCPSIPLPKVLSFCSDCERSGIDCEYLLMKKLPGKPLDDIWKTLDRFEQREVILCQIARILGDMKAIRFLKIGSLQFRKEISDTYGLGVDMERIDISKDVYIGPGLEAEAGPFDTYLDFLNATGKTELEYLKSCPFMLEGQGSDLLLRIQALLEAFGNPVSTPFPPAVCNVPFVMTHGDFEPRNILVDETTLEITGLVDFEFSGSFPIDDDWFAGLGNFGAGTSEWSIFNEEPFVDEDHPHPDVIAPVKECLLEQCKLYQVLPPSEIPGHETRALMYFFKANICPWFLRERVDPIPEDWYRERDSARRRVLIVLKKYGF